MRDGSQLFCGVHSYEGSHFFYGVHRWGGSRVLYGVHRWGGSQSSIGVHGDSGSQLFHGVHRNDGSHVQYGVHTTPGLRAVRYHDSRRVCWNYLFSSRPIRRNERGGAAALGRTETGGSISRYVVYSPSSGPTSSISTCSAWVTVSHSSAWVRAQSATLAIL